MKKQKYKTYTDPNIENHSPHTKIDKITERLSGVKEDTTQQIILKENTWSDGFDKGFKEGRTQALEELGKWIKELEWNYTKWSKEKWLEYLKSQIKKEMSNG